MTHFLEKYYCQNKQSVRFCHVDFFSWDESVFFNFLVFFSFFLEGEVYFFS